ncbi:MAG: hypothetical protein WBG53_25395 [Rhodococcus sp. (in: high G+C Gram-positive bacteria)]|uniref:hypothetical protein n=1 Tax=Rhodococcus sp. SBT000017 TaxID=1803385 RepID=UPI000EF9679F|nr:hypothetical protein [Rhodococcus sp. SBT000017]RMB78269.1 hypothetical protein AYK61_19370 [Rhodococcus sp. SBT000017]
MSIHSIRPEDVLPDGAERASFDGLEIRKGTVAAFVANARALDDAEQGTETHRELLAALGNLAPQLAAIGLLEVFEPRNPQIAELVKTAVARD